uniref:protein-tyrosine-phosphatase n=1 Tax=Strigamia maritima TaxID=126957 RepID=T1JED7_STRMM
MKNGVAWSMSKLFQRTTFTSDEHLIKSSVQMPFKLKLKKTRQYNVVSKNVFIISVELLDNTVVECTLTSDSTGQDCLSNVCQRLGLQQVEYFGLRFASKRLKYQWVELDKPLKKQLDKFALQETYVYLGIMFYVDDVHQLQDEVTRYQYFLQLKSDIINGRLPANQEQAVQLASYSLQAEFGDHDPERHTAEYLKGFLLLPKYMINDQVLLENLTEKIVFSHRNLTGLSQAAAEIYYIIKTQQLDGYGQETCVAKDDSGLDVELSIATNGVHIRVSSGQQSTVITWKEIRNISFHKRNLILECGNIGQMLQFQLEEADVTKYLFKLCLLKLDFYTKGKIDLSGNGDCADFDKYTVTSLDTQHILNQYESLKGSLSNVYQERRQSAEEIRIPFSQSDTALYEDYPYPYPSGSQLNEALHGGDSIYSINSLGRSNPNFVQNFNSASSLSIPSGRLSNPHLRALLPSYRPAPDYETAVQRKYGNHSASLGSLNGFPQHDPMFLPVKSYYHYKNFTDLRNLDAAVVAAPFLANSAQAGAHRTVDRLTPVSNLMLPPMHTYSTPELTTQGLHVPETEALVILHHQAKPPPPPYPYNQRSSAPDLAGRSTATSAVALPNSSSLNVIASQQKTAVNKQNGITHSAILEDVCEQRTDSSHGPMMVAAMNGLTLSRPNMMKQQQQQPVTESSCPEGLIFKEFEGILKKRVNADYSTALLAENAPRNRFKDVLPYEDNRVRLSPTKENNTGYINASHISVTLANRQHFYIAAQGALANTVGDFWQMVWEQHSQLIVMLTELHEQGRSKCFPYWPRDNQKLEFQEFRVSHKFSTKSTSYTTSLLTLEHLPSKKQRDIWHIQYTDWPDHGCPNDVHGFLNFMEEIDSVRRHTCANESTSSTCPLVVHCSAGVGRTGVTILTDLMLNCVDYEKIDVAKFLTCLRQQRMLIVQTVAQYKFVYTVLSERLKNSRLI